MKWLAACLVTLGIATAAWLAAAELAPITINYPEDGSVFPPEITAPTFIWLDATETASLWRIEVAFADGSGAIRVQSRGERLRLGDIDPRAVAPTNKLPVLSPQQAAARTWTPDADTWTAMKKRSISHPATVTITGLAEGKPDHPISRGSIRIHTSQDPVGAPIFYRDVPLMPSVGEKGVIKPLAADAVPLIRWRLRNIGESSSRVVMEGLHTCANCHSFSRDGKTLGMDLDGPQNDKGMYTLVPIQPQMSIRNEDVITWSSFRGKLTGNSRIGFMSQVSPDGRYVVTTIKGPDLEPSDETAASNYYVANFKDYRFLQVFYPTRGILAWYSRETGRLQPLPGADDSRYVQTSAVWTPDGKYLVFARAEAKDAYPAGHKLAEYANDPNETPIQYDLYRIPFNGGKGGQAERIAGASQNGMSNTFPKVSPDGRWIVFVRSRNGQLMRPDGQLYIVPFTGGRARRMRANTPLMNSWHSFSPNGRWMVFSSKSRSPYTQMFLTHLDEGGGSSPAILVDNATAANRAVNIPEFVNIPPDGLLKIEVPAVEYYRLYDLAWEIASKGRYEEAVVAWKEALDLNQDDPKAYINLGAALVQTGKVDEAIGHYQRALEIDPGSGAAHNDLGIALATTGKLHEAITHYQKALDLSSNSADAHSNLGLALAGIGKLDEAITHYQKALEIDPQSAKVYNNLGIALAGMGKPDDAVSHYRKALEINPEFAEAHNNLGLALGGSGKLGEAISHFEKALEISPGSAEIHGNVALALASSGRLEEGITHYQRALEITPGSAEVHNELGLALASAGKADEAIAHFEQAIEIDTAFTEARFNLGATFQYLKKDTPEALVQWRQVLEAEPNNVLVLYETALILATSAETSVRNGAEAVVLAERAAELSGRREAVILDTLAAAYAEAGRFPEAVKTARLALGLAIEAKQQPLAEALRTRIALYGAARPLRFTEPQASSLPQP